MKKITVFFLCLLASVYMQAQNYLIDFTSSAILDSVLVENITQGTSLTLAGNDTLELSLTTSISNQNQNSGDFKIYPNPMNNESNIEIYNEVPTLITIDIFDVTGKNIIQKTQEVDQGISVFEINGFSSGVYIVNVSSNNWQKTVSFISLNNQEIKPHIELKNTTFNKTQNNFTFKSTKSIFIMPYTNGDIIRFTGFSNLSNDIIFDIPSSSKTIDFDFSAFVCGDNVTFLYNGQIVTYGTVSSLGECWLDRNLGASQVATSKTDTAAYGDLFQWGRGSDGHQIRTSGDTTTLSTTDIPGHSKFIISGSSPYDWRNPQDTNLWQGISGTNNPCPCGFRLPTEAEWEAELTSWSYQNAVGAFGSHLKLPVAGVRSSNDGSFLDVGSAGGCWGSTVDDTYACRLYFDGIFGFVFGTYRAFGYSVRCIKD